MPAHVQQPPVEHRLGQLSTETLMTGHEDDMPAMGHKLEQSCVSFQTELCFLGTTQFSIHHQSKVCTVSGA